MQILIEPPIFTGLPSLPIVSDKKERHDRNLSSLYRGTDKNYEIECRYSACRTKCVFHNPDLGFVLFDRHNETVIGSEKSINDHYLQHLRRAIKQWKKQFNDFDRR
jgi:hypothetical protein